MRYNDPFDQMNRLFDHTRRMMWLDLDPTALVPRAPALGGGSKSFHLDLEETEDGYVIRADVPAFDPDDLDISFDDGVLTIQAEQELTEEVESGWSRRTRRIVERLTVVDPIVEDEMTASYHNGVLEIHLPTESVGPEDDDRVDIDIDVE